MDRIKDNYNEIVDENGALVNPLDDDYDFYRQERDRRNDPLDDDYIPEEYR